MRTLLLALLALAVNVLLFLGLAWANATSKAPPRRDGLVLREVFHAAPPPRAEALAEEVPRELPETPPPAGSASALSSAGPAEAPAPGAFGLRGALPGMDLGAGGPPSGPASRADGAGGSPDGVPGGRPDGVPGGTGTGPAVYSVAQVDRGPRRALTPLGPYPQWARAGRLEGVVTLRIVVDASGQVTDVLLQGVDGDDRFGPEALATVRHWVYEPAVFNGKPVAVTLIQRIRYQLVDR